MEWECLPFLRAVAVMHEMLAKTETDQQRSVRLKWEALAAIAEAEAEREGSSPADEIRALVEAWDCAIDTACEERRAEIAQWFRAFADQAMSRPPAKVSPG
jgi:hypothetical protein